jgi:hypothetical protein
MVREIYAIRKYNKEAIVVFDRALMTDPCLYIRDSSVVTNFTRVSRKLARLIRNNNKIFFFTFNGDWAIARDNLLSKRLRELSV